MIGSSLVVSVILIIVFVVLGVYVWSSVNHIAGKLIGAGFLIVALILALIVSGII